MIPTTLWHIWGFRIGYVLLALGYISYQLLPLGPAEGLLVAPDLLLALTIAWLLRQPSVVPIGLIALVFLLADFLLQRPPGLLTAITLLVTEFLKFRRIPITEFNFLIEWSLGRGRGVGDHGRRAAGALGAARTADIAWPGAGACAHDRRHLPDHRADLALSPWLA